MAEEPAEAAAEDPQPQLQAASQLQMQQQFVLSAGALNSAFGGVVEAHNGLTQLLSDTKRQVDAARAEQARDSSKLNELSRSYEESSADHSKRLDGVSASLDETRASLETLVRESADQLRQERREAITALEDGLQPRLSALEKSLEDVVSRVADLASVALPRQRADIDAGIAKLANELSAQRSAAEVERQRQDLQTRDIVEEFRRADAELSARLESDLAALRSDLQLTHGSVEAVAARGVAVESRLDATCAELGRRLSAEVSRLEVLAAREATETRNGIREDEGARLSRLEGVVKQAEFERLASARQLSGDLEELQSSWRASCTEAAERIAAVEAAVRRDLEALRAQGEERLSLQVREATTRQTADASRLEMSLAEGLAKAERERGDLETSLSRLVETETSRLERFAKEEASGALTAAQNDERWGDLRRDLQEAQSTLGAAQERLGSELKESREELGACERTGRRQEAAAAAAAGQAEQMQQAINDLASGLRSISNGQRLRDDELVRLEELVREVEVRRWPWRAAMQRQRSSSPPTSASTRTLRPSVTFAGGSVCASTASTTGVHGGGAGIPTAAGASRQEETLRVTGVPAPTASGGPAPAGDSASSADAQVMQRPRTPVLQGHGHARPGAFSVQKFGGSAGAGSGLASGGGEAPAAAPLEAYPSPQAEVPLAPPADGQPMRPAPPPSGRRVAVCHCGQPAMQRQAGMPVCRAFPRCHT
eukprot:TRINITY_DN15515_c0_g1_i1.p1 TRINITY_DN15515_c0_g1~~TRINITY_DN15515_c0_g1_i1.p1  ORF type:complete len:758 (+),score=201.52 TRINITY_DN15515_c0_g1_i1:120-2276(+)